MVRRGGRVDGGGARDRMREPGAGDDMRVRRAGRASRRNRVRAYGSRAGRGRRSPTRPVLLFARAQACGNRIGTPAPPGETEARARPRRTFCVRKRGSARGRLGGAGLSSFARNDSCRGSDGGREGRAKLPVDGAVFGILGCNAVFRLGFSKNGRRPRDPHFWQGEGRAFLGVQGSPCLPWLREREKVAWRVHANPDVSHAFRHRPATGDKIKFKLNFKLQ